MCFYLQHCNHAKNRNVVYFHHDPHQCAFLCLILRRSHQKSDIHEHIRLFKSTSITKTFLHSRQVGFFLHDGLVCFSNNKWIFLCSENIEVESLRDCKCITSMAISWIYSFLKIKYIFISLDFLQLCAFNYLVFYKLIWYSFLPIKLFPRIEPENLSSFECKFVSSVLFSMQT